MSRSLILPALALLFFSCHGNEITNPFERCTGLGFGEAASLEGRLHTPEGAPVTGVKVTLDGNVQTDVDVNGRFAFVNTTAGLHSLSYSPASFGLSGQLQLTKGRNVVDIVTPTNFNSGWAAGRVLDACTGRPIAGAQIGTETSFVTTGTDGTYNKFACCNSSFGESVRANGYAPAHYGVARVFGRTQLMDFVLERVK
jgi:hypothetical protein